MEDLVKENEKLKAHIERLKIVACMVGYQDSCIDYDLKNKILDETPSDSLNQIKAQTLKDLVYEAIRVNEQFNQDLIAFGEASRVRELDSIDINWINLEINKLERM